MKETPDLFVGPVSAHFDNTSWPVPCTKAEALDYRLRYDEKPTSTSDRLYAASIITAYCALINKPERRRRRIIRMIREAQERIALREAVTP